MAGETYGSVGAAFGAGLDDFLLRQQKQKHDALMDRIAQQNADLAQRREERVAKSEALESQIRREELTETIQEHTRARHKQDRSELFDDLRELVPGDIPSADLNDRAVKLGVNIPKGPAPAVPIGQSQVQLPQSSMPPEMGGVPPPMSALPGAQPSQSFPSAAPYLGTRGDRARSELAGLMESGADTRTKIVPSALRLGMDPKEIGQIVTADMGPAPKTPTAEPSFVAFDAKGKEMPGIVQMSVSGSPMLNGQPLPPGVTVKRAPTPRDPLLDRETQLRISKLQQDLKAGQNSGGALTPSETRMAQDMAAGKLTYDDVLRSYAFQRTGRERARLIYDNARTMNPSLNPVSIKAEMRAYTGELSKLQNQLGAVDSYAKAADLNAKLLDKVLDKVPDTGFAGKPNEWARHTAKFLGSEDQVAFDGLMTSLQSEYSRLISNPNLTGVVTDTTRKEFRDILDKGGTKGQIRRLLKTLQQESGNRRAGIASTIDDVKKNIGDVADAPSDKPDTPAKRKSPDDILKGVMGGR